MPLHSKGAKHFCRKLNLQGKGIMWKNWIGEGTRHGSPHLGFP